MGVNIALPREQLPNRNVTPGLSFEFRSLFMRKLISRSCFDTSTTPAAALRLLT